MNHGLPSRGFIRRAGLFVIGAAPFVFFLLLLPPDRPTDSFVAAPTSEVSPTAEAAPLEFPFLNGPSPTPSEAEEVEEEKEVSSTVPATRATPTTLSGPAATIPSGTVPTTMPAGAPAAPAPPSRFGAPAPACSNGVDDDGDGSPDLADPGCSSGADHAESDNPQCSDGLDDDGDGTVDFGDPGCSSPRDGDESDDNIIPTDNPQNQPGEPGGQAPQPDEEDPLGLEGLPS